jgi:alkylation response protein AidB-like acyl-CoA dehydrogenase
MDRFDASAAVAALVDTDHPIKTKAAEWAATHLVDPDQSDRDRACVFWEQGWARLAEQGILGLLVDPAWGGSGLGAVDTLLHFEGLGYGSNDLGLVFAASSTVWTILPMIERFGSDEQKARYLPGAVDGSHKIAYCMTEAEAGSNSFALATTFRTETVDGVERHVLSGVKSYITLAPVADAFIVFATSDPTLGQWGISAFLVDADTPGVTVTANRPKMGLRTVPFSDVHFDECVLGPEQLLGKPGAGAAMFTHSMVRERAFILSPQVGAMERRLHDAADYARQRQPFGHPIADFQAVGHRLARMRLGHENARLQMYRCALQEGLGQPAMDTAALAKIQISEASIETALDAVRTHGATGYVTEFGVEQHLRDVTGGVIYGGTTDVQNNLIADAILRRRR